MPEDVTARHRATGVGRLLALRTAIPRHSVATGPPPPWWPGATAVLALVMLAAITPLALPDPATPQVAVLLPTVSVPALPTETPSASRRPLRAVRQAAKASPAPSSATPGTSASAVPVLLGPADDAELPALLGSYCRATYGGLTVAVSTSAGWFCAPLGRTAVTLDLDAMCRWRYGDSTRSGRGDATNPRSWRCYRDGP